ncbi:hypothetical protein C3L33_12034, partial [Rhododendron williamsianum]
DWTGDMEDDDHDYETEYDITSAILRDDKESLIPLIKSLHLRYKNNRFGSRREIWRNICMAGALNCATSMLEGELGAGGGVNMPISGGFFRLHYAAMYESPGIVKLLISRGAQTDVRVYNPENPLDHHGLLPLGIALEHLSERRRLRCFSGQNAFSPEKSTFQLIASLCLPVLKRSLEVCKLLALSSKNVAKEAYNYAAEGKLTEFAVLLMVAREKVLVPITFSREDGDGWNGSTTVHQYLKNAIGSLVDEEFKLPGSIAKKKLAPTNWNKMVFRSTALVLEVFERAGDAIEEYLQLEHRCVCRLIPAPCFVSSYLASLLHA